MNYNFEVEPNNQIFLPGKSVTDVIKDKEGGYWFSTLQDSNT